MESGADNFNLRHASGHRSGLALNESTTTGTLRMDGWDEMSPDERVAAMTRRSLLARSAVGPGAAALFSLLSGTGAHQRVLAADDIGASGQSAESNAGHSVAAGIHHPAKIRRVIWLTMAGGPSQFETFDPKPKLAEMDGQPMPDSFTKGQQLAQLQGQALLCQGPQFLFRKFGRQQTEISTLLPHIGSMIDDVCLIRSMTTDAINHDPAHLFMNTGSQLAGRPSMGAWVTYGLGTESENLPGFVVLVSTAKGRTPQPIAARQWGNGFLPGKFQGVQLRSRGEPVLYLDRPEGMTVEQQRADVAAITSLNRRFDRVVHDPEIATRIAQYEMAFRMQMSVPELMDVGSETQDTFRLYGCEPGDGSFASNCLLARRLAERGSRFIQLYHRDWDHHSQLREELPLRCADVDRACLGLVRDLQRRGMFEDTLIVWSGEFGRTPMAQKNKGTIGRDHHNKSMSLWVAGGGIQRGLVYGATDDLGYAAVDRISTVHDLHATMLHLLGIDHSRFTFRFQGLDAKLTGVEDAHILNDILT